MLYEDSRLGRLRCDKQLYVHPCCSCIPSPDFAARRGSGLAVHTSFTSASLANGGAVHRPEIAHEDWRSQSAESSVGTILAKRTECFLVEITNGLFGAPDELELAET